MKIKNKIIIYLYNINNNNINYSIINNNMKIYRKILLSNILLVISCIIIIKKCK